MLGMRMHRWGGSWTRPVACSTIVKSHMIIPSRSFIPVPLLSCRHTPVLNLFRVASVIHRGSVLQTVGP